MGKKNRKKSTSGPAAPEKLYGAPLPSVVLESIDRNVCAVCHDKLDVDFWNNKKFAMMECCGHFLCLSCQGQTDEAREEAKNEAESLQSDFRGGKLRLDPSNILPKLVKITTGLNPPCAVCGTALPDTQKQIHNRLVRLAEAGHMDAQYSLGQAYKNGSEFVRKDPGMAIKWLKMAVDNGDTKSCVTLGDMHHSGNDIPQSFTEAKKWYERAPNNAIAQNGLAHILRDGKGVPRDRERAMELFRKSAEQDLPSSLYVCGEELVLQGRIAEAKMQYEKGARLEKHIAEYPRHVALCQEQTAWCIVTLGTRDEQDGNNPANDPFPEALFWARRAVKNGLDERMLKQLEANVQCRCRHCKKPDPQAKCSKCRAVLFCDKVRFLFCLDASFAVACRYLGVRILKLVSNACLY